MSAEQVDHYALLCAVARKHGWKLLLHSDHFGGKAGGEELISQLSCLELTNGDGMIARASLLPEDRLADVAASVLSRLQAAGMLAA